MCVILIVKSGKRKPGEKILCVKKIYFNSDKGLKCEGVVNKPFDISKNIALFISRDFNFALLGNLSWNRPYWFWNGCDICWKHQILRFSLFITFLGGAIEQHNSNLIFRVPTKALIVRWKGIILCIVVYYSYKIEGKVLNFDIKKSWNVLITSNSLMKCINVDTSDHNKFYLILIWLKIPLM